MDYSGIVPLSTTDALSGIDKLLFVSTPEILAQHIHLIPFQNCGPEMEGSGGISLSDYYSLLRTNEDFEGFRPYLPLPKKANSSFAIP